MPEKQSLPANEGDRPAGWTALRRGWNTNRGSAFPGGSRSTETSSDPSGKSPWMKTGSTEHLKQTPLHQLTAADFCKAPTLLQRTNSADTFKSRRTNSVQPLKATAPLCGTNGSSSVTTIIPQSKASFSSITISSRKVCRSASLPGSDSSKNSPRGTPPPTFSDKPMDQDSRQVTVQRKATIVKVTEQRVVSSPVTSTNNAKTPPVSQAIDTVVQRRKATIIKVTEHRERYTPAKVVARNPENRHSYTEGLYKENNIWSQEKHSEHNVKPSYSQHPLKGPNSSVSPRASTSEPEKNTEALHRSTLNLFVSNPPALPSPAPSSEVSPRAVGHRSDRPQRPQSCYGNVFGHSAASNNDVTQPVARKWSFGLPLETQINPANSDSVGFVSPQMAAKEPGQLEADTFKPNGSGKDERLPPENAARRASPCLTLIKAPGKASFFSSLVFFLSAHRLPLSLISIFKGWQCLNIRFPCAVCVFLLEVITHFRVLGLNLSGLICLSPLMPYL